MFSGSAPKLSQRAGVVGRAHGCRVYGPRAVEGSLSLELENPEYVFFGCSECDVYGDKEREGSSIVVIFRGKAHLIEVLFWNDL